MSSHWKSSQSILSSIQELKSSEFHQQIMWCSHVTHANDTTSSVLLLHTHTQRPLNHVSDVVWERPAHRHTRLALGWSRSRHAQQCMWSLPVMWSRASTAVSMLQWLTLRLDTCSSRTNSSPPPRGSAGICLTSLLFMLFLLSVWLRERQRYYSRRQKKEEWKSKEFVEKLNSHEIWEE